ncbi:MAG TPA: hypothetical protein VH817_02700 [Thermoleophilaceae bacterium]
MRSWPTLLSAAVLSLAPASAQALQPLGSWGSSGTGQLNQPYDLAVNPETGDQYVADHDNNRIVEFNASGGFVRAWGSSGSGDTQFSGPVGIGLDSAGNVWVADEQNNRVKEFDADGNLLHAFGTTGMADGQLFEPSDVAVDSAGNFYEAEQGGRIQKFAPNGDFIKTWAVSNPTGIAITGSTIYAANYNSENVQVFDTDGNPLGSFGGSGNGAGQFSQPWHLTVDPLGNLYVADRSNARVDAFTSSGGFINAFGWGVADGNAAFQICTTTCQQGLTGSGEGQFSATGGVGFDCRGNLYVADQGTSTVQKFGEPGTAALPCHPSTPPPPSPSPPAAKDTVAPTISSARLSHSVFAVSRGGAATARKKKRAAPKGTTISYRLSEAATVEFTIRRKSSGRKVGKSCKRPTRRNGSRKRCTRFLKQGTFTQGGTAGANSEPFSGKLGRKLLKPGSYRLTITATDPAGNRSKSVSRSFRIVH